MTTQFFVKNSQYMDSVTLMKIARDLRNQTQVDDVALLMGTAANKKLLEQVSPLSPEAEAASATDLIIMITGEDDNCQIARQQLDTMLTVSVMPPSSTQSRPISTLKNALKNLPHANLVMISLPAQYAVAEAWQALYQQKHVFLFSDNISIQDEKALKQYAVAHHLLLMGPGAGTSIINGVGLGFSNEVLSGNIGIVSASGTGLQEVTTLLAKEGVGISQAIGVGSRDLSKAIGGLMCFQAIEALKADPSTELMMVISKLPSPEISDQVMQALSDSGKPSVVIFMTLDQAQAQDSIYVAHTLQEAALAAAYIVRGNDPYELQSSLDMQMQSLKIEAKQLRALLNPEQKYVRGLFSGGTLCEEAMRVWRPYIGDVWSNVPFSIYWELPDSNYSLENSAIDLGEEEFTVGRPHPMIDNELRINRILAEARNALVAVIQLDIVLGYVAHENPASELAPAIQQAKEIAARRDQELIVIASLVGTDSDPQNLDDQKAMLESVGVIVKENNAAASLLTAFIIGANYDTAAS